MTPFKGQTENAGHFLQPTTNAMEHKVIALLLLSLSEYRAKRDVAYERHCDRGGADMQTSSDHLGTAREASTGLVERLSFIGRFLKHLKNPGCATS